MAAGAAIGVAALVTLGKQAFELGSSFDEQFDKIQAKTGATGERLSALQDDFRAVASNARVGFDEVGTAVAGLNQRLKLQGDQLQSMSQQTIEFARLTKTDLNETIRLSTRVFGDWGVQADDYEKTLDKIFVAHQKTGVGVVDLMQNVVQFGAPLRQLGFGIDETIALYSKWEQEGVNVETVSGSLRIAVARLTEANVPLKEGFRAVLDAIKNAPSDVEATSMALQVFGSRAGPDMAAAIREGRFSVEELQEAIAEAGGNIRKTGDDTADASERMQQSLNRMGLAFEPVGTAVFTLAGAIAEGLGGAITEIAPDLKNFIDSLNPDLADGSDEADKGVNTLAADIASLGRDVGGAIRELREFLGLLGRFRDWHREIMAGGGIRGAVGREIGDAWASMFGEEGSAVGGDWSVVRPSWTGTDLGGEPHEGLAAVGATFGVTDTRLQFIGLQAIRNGLGEEGARTAIAIARLEAGLRGQVGDGGNSFGAFQFHRRGELPNFARAMGLSSLGEAESLLRRDPLAGVNWALSEGGYLYNWIQRGILEGRSGADLAEFVQTNAQRSQNPSAVRPHVPGRGGVDLSGLFDGRGGGAGGRAGGIGVPDMGALAGFEAGIPLFERQQGFIEAQGQMGAGLSEALLAAWQSNTEQNGQRLVDAYGKLASQVGDETAQELQNHLRTALADGADESIQAAIGFITDVGQALAAAGGEQGTRAAGELLGKYKDAFLREGRQAFADIQKEQLDIFRTGQQDAAINRQRDQEDADKVEARLQRDLDRQASRNAQVTKLNEQRRREDENLEEEHLQRLAEIRARPTQAISQAQVDEARRQNPLGFRVGQIGAASDPVAEENKRYEAAVARLKNVRAEQNKDRLEGWAEDDKAIAEQDRRQDAQINRQRARQNAERAERKKEETALDAFERGLFDARIAHEEELNQRAHQVAMARIAAENAARAGGSTEGEEGEAILNGRAGGGGISGELLGVGTNPSFLARGARNFRGGMAIVGEEGPELVHLPRGATVYPNNSAPIENHVHVMLGGNREIAELIIDALTGEVRVAGALGAGYASW